MNKYEYASFYGDYSMLLAEIADELSSENVEAVVVHESFAEAVQFIEA